MCRGGKDGVKKRCKVNASQRSSAALRKRVKYHADKEGMTPEDWKTANPDMVNDFRKELFPVVDDVSFQPIGETRRLPEGVPMLLNDHIEANDAKLQHLNDDERVALAGYTSFGAGVVNNVLRAGSHEVYDYYEHAPKWRETKGPGDFADKEDFQDYLETTDRLLENREEERRVIYRGIPIYTELHDEIGDSIGKKLEIEDTDGLVQGLKEYYKPGKVLEYDTYLSTTLSANYAADRTSNSVDTKADYWRQPEIKGIVFEMKTNAGLDVTSVARHNAYEREVILPRETRFKVVNVEVKPDYYDTVGGYDYPSHPDELNEDKYTGIAAVVQLVEVDKDGNEIMHTEPHKPVKQISDIFTDKK